MILSKAKYSYVYADFIQCTGYNTPFLFLCRVSLKNVLYYRAPYIKDFVFNLLLLRFYLYICLSSCYLYAFNYMSRLSLQISFNPGIVVFNVLYTFFLFLFFINLSCILSSSTLIHSSASVIPFLSQSIEFFSSPTIFIGSGIFAYLFILVLYPVVLRDVLLVLWSGIIPVKGVSGNYTGCLG